MIPAPSEHATLDGRAYTVRAARPADAGVLLDHVHDVHARDPHVNLTDPGEAGFEVGRLRALAAALGDDPGGLLLLAVAAGDLVVGSLFLEPGRYRKTAHVASLGMSVRRGWRRQGVAAVLLGRAIVAAIRSDELRKITLRVFASNTAALALYDKFGFVVEGRFKDEIRIDGRFVDELKMALPVA